MRVRPSSRIFVVRGLTREDAERRTRELPLLVQLSELEGHDDVVLLSLRDGPEDAELTWKMLRDQLEAEVEPLLEEQGGRTVLPIGTLAVRFRREPDDGELQSFAQRHDLEMVERNRFQPGQCVFRPLDPRAVYVPALIDELEREKDVRSAWSQTLQRYRRLGE